MPTMRIAVPATSVASAVNGFDGTAKQMSSAKVKESIRKERAFFDK